MKKYVVLLLFMLISLVSSTAAPTPTPEVSPPPKIGDCLKKIVAFEKHIPDMVAVSRMNAKQLEQFTPREMELVNLYDYKLLVLKFKGSMYLVEDDNADRRVVFIRVIPRGMLTFE
jgi:hypothetical protein